MRPDSDNSRGSGLAGATLGQRLRYVDEVFRMTAIMTAAPVPVALKPCAVSRYECSVTWAGRANEGGKRPCVRLAASKLGLRRGGLAQEDPGGIVTPAAICISAAPQPVLFLALPLVLPGILVSRRVHSFLRCALCSTPGVAPAPQALGQASPAIPLRKEPSPPGYGRVANKQLHYYQHRFFVGLNSQAPTRTSFHPPPLHCRVPRYQLPAPTAPSCREPYPPVNHRPFLPLLHGSPSSLTTTFAASLFSPLRRSLHRPLQPTSNIENSVATEQLFNLIL